MKSLVIVFSYHHKNTEKIAKVFADVLCAQIKTPQQINPRELKKYDLIGFGSGIDSGKHYKPMLDLADTLLQAAGKKAFVFSTCGVPFAAQKYMPTCHSLLKEKLTAKGYVIVDEFICRGFNTNSFLKYFGGLNKGRPNADDLKNARVFAENLKSKVGEKQR